MPEACLGVRLTRIAFVTLIVAICLPLSYVSAEQPDGSDSSEATQLGSEIEVSEGEPTENWSVNLFLAETYRGRFALDPFEHDHDFNVLLDLSMASPSDSFGIDIMLDLWWEAGQPSEESDDPLFGSQYQQREGHVWLEAYKLSFEYRDVGVLKLIRAGRQVAEYGEPATFDGLTVTLRPYKPYLDLFLFGGRSVHFFKTDEGGFENWLAAGGALIRPTPYLRFELMYRFAREDSEIDGGELIDHEFHFQAWYRYEDYLRLRAFVQTVNEDLAYAGGAVRLAWPEMELGADLSVRAQTATLDDITESVNPFNTVLGRSLPHVRYRADLWKAFTTGAGIFALHLGYEGRQLTGDHTQTSFNRNSGRVYVLFTAYDIGADGPFLTLVFERWTEGASPTANGIWTGGGSLGYQADRFRVEAGSFYQRYKYDYYQDVRESLDVRTVYVEAGGKVLDWLRVRGRYEFEWIGRQVHNVTIGLVQTY